MRTQTATGRPNGNRRIGEAIRLRASHRLRFLGALLPLVLLCGCFDVKDELTIQPDGSGTVRIESRNGLPPGVASVVGIGITGRPGASTVYPPMGEAEARSFFPGKDFTVTAKQERVDDATVTIVEAKFKDINALLASPYGRAHALTLAIENGALKFKALTGLETLARLAEVKDDGELGLGMMAAGLGELQKQKDKMRAEFRVTFPNAITSANGTSEGKTVAWIVERAKLKDADEFAKQLGVVAEASCPADGLEMSPVTPTRLALSPFSQLPDEMVSGKEASLDTAAIAAAARFVPYALLVTRSLDLSGESGTLENGAQLSGAVVLPAQFAPERWGETTLNEVVDSKGNNLKFENEGDSFRSYTRYSRFSMGEDADEQEANATEVRHDVSLNFRPPEWRINEIAKINGSVSMQYFGGAELVKLTNAIPAKWISEGRNSIAYSFSSSSGLRDLDDPKLDQLGLSISLQTAMVQSGMTVLILQTEGTKAALSDAQVFDADGNPWPTMIQGTEENSFGDTRGRLECTLVVAGRPQPPLSLGLSVSAGGTTVEVPIQLEHVPVVAD